MSKEKKILGGENGEKNLVGNNFCPFCPLTHVTHFELFTYEKFWPLQEIHPALIRMYCRQHLSLAENTPLAKDKCNSLKLWNSDPLSLGVTNCISILTTLIISSFSYSIITNHYLWGDVCWKILHVLKVWSSLIISRHILEAEKLFMNPFLFCKKIYNLII